jgi:hypothetical protein
MTEQIAENNLRREAVRLIKLLLFTVAAVISLATTPAVPARATWASVAISGVLTAVVALLVEGAFRGRWERRKIREIAAQNDTSQRRRRKGDAKPVLLVVTEPSEPKDKP